MPSERDRFGRPDPDALLARMQAAERAERRGQLKIFLGYAPGVGKSFRLFDEGRRRRDRGEDVIVAATQPKNEPQVEEIARGLETISTLEIAGVPVIDVDAVRTRHPQVCIVDGLAYDNPPGSAHPKRYQDVEALLAAGISVLTSLNIDYIEEQQDFVEGITGRRQSQAVPQPFVKQADEVVIVDTPPDSSTPWHTDQLSKLRQRALLLAADVVDAQLESYLRAHGIQSTWGTQERILVCMTPRANAAAMLASGRRNADRFHGELFAVYVNQANLTIEDRMALDRNVTLAKAQQAQIEILDAKDPIGAILECARAKGITQLYVGHNLQSDWKSRLTGTLLDRLIADADGIDVRVFPH
jgi:two-component system sensor histidine kinase KdpD